MKLNYSIFILFVSALSCAAAVTGFERYQLILDRHPFGDVPLEGDLAIVPADQSFARNMRLSMMFERTDGSIRVGFVDSTSNKSYILGIGETQDGLELIEANIQSSEAMLRKGNEVVLFKLEAGTPAQQVTKAQQNTRQQSYTDRRKALLQKIEDQRKPEEPPPQPRLTGEALRKHLEGVQMDAIRNGLPPLPIPLTPEMDAQLVNEGVLPPQ